MEAPGRLADHLLEPALDIHVNVFERARKRECAGGDLGLHLIEPAPNFGRVGFRDDALFGEHSRMRLRAFDVLGKEALVEADRGVDFLHDGIGARGKSAAPHLVGHPVSFTD